MTVYNILLYTQGQSHTLIAQSPRPMSYLPIGLGHHSSTCLPDNSLCYTYKDTLQRLYTHYRDQIGLDMIYD